MVKLSGLIFDMDGTLFDTSRDITRSVNFTLERLGLPLRTQGEVEEFIGDGMRTLLERAAGRSDDEFIGQAVEIFWPHYEAHCIMETRLYPGVKETLEHFSSKPLALVSNKPYAMVQKILEHFGIQNRFQAVLGGESTREKKPHPEPVLKSLELLKLEACDCMIVGDGPTDIQAGKAAGTRTCAVAYGFKSRKILEACKPDFFIERIENLKDIVF